MLASVIASMEQCALQLCDQQLSEAKLTATLKFLRLYWRAFQGQLLCYLSMLTSEVRAHDRPRYTVQKRIADSVDIP